MFTIKIIPANSFEQNFHSDVLRKESYEKCYYWILNI